jgi:EF-hand domain pair
MPITRQQKLYSSVAADRQRTSVVDQSESYIRDLYFVSKPSNDSPPAVIDTPNTLASHAVTESDKPVTKKVAKKATASHQEGVFSPVVYVAKDVLGAERLNKLRGDIIALHSDAIKGFVATADSKIGQVVLKQLFALADQNKDGKIDKDELRVTLKALRFEWLAEKQVNGIFERADLDSNGEIDLDEWMREAPATLKTNLVKLAKSNGGKMGLLV